MIIKRGRERREETLEKHKKLTKTTDKKAKRTQRTKKEPRKTTPYRDPAMALHDDGGATVSCIDCDNMKKFAMVDFKPLSQGEKKFVCECCDAVFKLKIPMEWLQ